MPSTIHEGSSETAATWVWVQVAPLSVDFARLTPSGAPQATYTRPPESTATCGKPPGPSRTGVVTGTGGAGVGGGVGIGAGGSGAVTGGPVLVVGAPPPQPASKIRMGKRRFIKSRLFPTALLR